MCGRLSQYHGIHDFVAALSIPNTLLNYAGVQPLERYNAAPTTQLALFHRDGEYLRADMVRWGWVHIGPGIAPRRSTPGWRKSPMDRSSKPSGPTGPSSRSTTGLSGFMKAAQKKVSAP